MPFFADLHVHSKFARATSGDSDLAHLALWAAKKGVAVLGTGDFTHPGWLAEIREQLVPAEPGLFRLRPHLEAWATAQFPAFAACPTRFVVQVEISTIYKKAGRTRKVHHCVYVPELAAAEGLRARLARIGNLEADGRPILGLDSRDLLEMVLETSDHAWLVPAHIWTPWFAALGSKSGFDSIEECYGDLTPHIFALETGLSSDPPMNWRLSQLDRFQLVSNSDAHSPGKIGREACRFDCTLDYFALRRALETGQGYGGTVEFFPEEGKYHLDGHRACGVCLEPEETRRHRGLCPACGKELTVGVLHRVAELADRPPGAAPAGAKPFRSLVPLAELLAEILRVGPASRKVQDTYETLLRQLGPELFILEEAPLDEVRKANVPLLAEGIERMRQGRVRRQAGYDGAYGVIRLFSDQELAPGNAASLLFALPKGPEPSEPPKAVGPSPQAEESLERFHPDAAAPPPEPAVAAPPAPGAEARRGEHRACVSTGESWLLAEAPAPALPLACDPLAGLDPEQRAAAQITRGPLLIIAGPGTGKTRTLTHRIAHLIGNCGVEPEQILAVTFTHRAADELRERLQRLVPAVASRVLVTTFHGLGHRILREHGGKLGLPAGWRLAGEAERKGLLVEQLQLSERQAARLLKQVSEWKRRGRALVGPAPGLASPLQTGTRSAGQPPAGAPESAGLPDEQTRQVFAAYQRALAERGWLDYEDLIGLPAQLLQAEPAVCAQYRAGFRHLSVDEFQDIDGGQYRLIQSLAPPGGWSEASLCVIGDPDQAIYGFRGTDARWFEQFAADYPAAATVVLRRNYRSSRAIVQGALQAIAPASRVAGRAFEARSAEAARITIHEAPTDKAEAEFVVQTIEQLLGGHAFFSLDSGRVRGGEGRRDYSFGDFAALYRTEAQADALSEALARSGIPFQRHSHALLADRPEVRRLLEALRQMPEGLEVWERLQAAMATARAKSELRTSKSEANSKSESNASPAGPSGAPALGSLADFSLRIADLARRCGRDLARFESELALLTDADQWDPRADRVSLLTLHASKGLEFAVVFLTGCEDGLLPLRFGTADAAELDEERRLFYVGMTRARERLFLTHARKRFWRGQVRTSAVSPFVAAIERELLERSQAPEWKRPDKPPTVQLDLFRA